MKQEFITSYGKVVIERDKIYILTLNRNVSYKGVGVLIFLFTLILAIFIPDISGWFMVFFFGVLTLSENFQFIKTLPKTSFSNRILLSEINATSIIDDPKGFDTLVNLHLKSGKTRTIRFRKLENQYQPFIETLSQHIEAPQIIV